MATPHASIAILQSHLQALYDVIILTFVIAMSLFPGALVLSVLICGEEQGGRRSCSTAMSNDEEETPLLHQSREPIEVWWQRGSPTLITYYAKSNLKPHLEPYRTFTDSNEPR